MMKKLLLTIIFVAFSAQIDAQTVVTPTHGWAQLKYLQDENGADGPDIGAVVHQFEYVVPAGQEVWISLGSYRYGDPHHLTIDCTGHSAHSNGVCQFTSSYNVAKPTVMRMDQFNWQGRYSLYSYKQGSWIGVIMKYKNDSPSTNNIKVTYMASQLGTWAAHVPDVATVTASDLMKSQIEVHKGYNYNDWRNGIYFNGETNFEENATFNHNVELNGDVILNQPQGDISMGAFGN